MRNSPAQSMSRTNLSNHSSPTRCWALTRVVPMRPVGCRLMADRNANSVTTQVAANAARNLGAFKVSASSSGIRYQMVVVAVPARSGRPWRPGVGRLSLGVVGARCHMRSQPCRRTSRAWLRASLAFLTTRSKAPRGPSKNVRMSWRMKSKAALKRLRRADLARLTNPQSVRSRLIDAGPGRSSDVPERSGQQRCRLRRPVGGRVR